jgi:small subunit ribosomal protein S6
MKRYETIVIVDPDLSDDQRRPVFDRIEELIPQQGGQLIKVEDWGARKLAYPIKKKPRGYYALIDFCGEGPLVSEMERFFKIDDRVMKFMTVLTDSHVDPSRITEDTDDDEPEAAAEGVTPSEGGETTVEPAQPDASYTEKKEE